ncbi:Iron-sulfur assembly protein 1 [Saitoella coloradoensis]
MLSTIRCLRTRMTATRTTVTATPFSFASRQLATIHHQQQPYDTMNTPPSPPRTTTSSSQSTPSLTSTTAVAAAAAQTEAAPVPAPRKRPILRARKAAMSLTPKAIEKLRTLLQTRNTLVKVGVKNKGCAGMSYDLSYVTTPLPFDESVSVDGVTVLIDNKALMSIIGSEMDWVEDRLSARFVFRNPNVKDTCGCGESFSVGRDDLAAMKNSKRV